MRVLAESGWRGGFIGIAIKAIREDEKGRCPEADEDAKALGMGLLFGGFAIEEPPDPDGEDNGKDASLETKGAERATDGSVHFRQMPCTGPSPQAWNALTQATRRFSQPEAGA